MCRLSKFYSGQSIKTSIISEKRRTKVKLAFLLFTISATLFSQKDIKAMLGSGRPEFNVLLEYIPQLDSTFGKRHPVSEIVVSEKIITNGKLVYEKPVLVNRYDSRGKLTHTGFNIWSDNENGALRYSDIYGDSVIAVTKEIHNYRNSGKVQYLSVSRIRHINDTLSRTVVYSYINDSLIRRVDHGIFDSKAEQREYRAKQKLNSTGQSFISTNPGITKEKSKNCILPDETYSPRDPGPELEKDSLGRIVKIKNDVVTEERNNPVLKHNTITFIEYYQSTDIFKSVKVYLLKGTKYYDVINFPADLKASEINQGAMYCEYKASDFQFGLPKLITIVFGKYEQNSRTYTAIIKTR